MNFTVFLNVILALAVLLLGIFSVKKKRSSRNTAVGLRAELSDFRDELIEFVPDGLLFINSQGNIIGVNTQIERLFGWKKKDLIGQSVEILMPPELRSNHDKLRSRFIGEDRERLMSPGRFAGGLTGMRKDNTTFNAEISLKPIEYHGTHLVVAGVRDISDRVKMYAEIDQVMVALDATDDAILIYEARTLRITYANEGAVRQLGYTRDEFLLMTLEDFNSEKSQCHLHKKLRKTRDAGGETQKYVDYHLTKDGREFPVELSMRFIDHLDSPYIVSVGRDISKQTLALDSLDVNASELKQVNRELELERKNLALEVKIRTRQVEKAKKRAEDANIAKSAFLASMSHEIRTPMNGVLGMIELLLASHLDSRQLERVSTLQDSALSLLTIIDEILDFSKIEAGKIEMANEAVDLVTTTDSIHASLLAIAESKNVTLSCYRDPTLVPVIVSDALRLRQIVTNLVGNSIKFSSGLERQGNVKLRFEAIADDMLRITVEDNGIGIKQASLKTIFEPFKQENISNPHSFGGTGLGLPISKMLIEKMQGTLTIESELGVGTKVMVNLPIVVADGKAEPEFAQNLQGVRCNLFVNDEDQARDWLSYLSFAGARVCHVNQPSDLMQLEKSDSNQSENTIGIAIDNILGADYFRLLMARGQRRGPARLIVVLPLSNKVITVVNKELTLLNSNPNRNTTFRHLLKIISGESVNSEFIADSEEPSDPASIATATATENEEKKVLVAEDNAINQNVICNQLEALGYAYELASNGKEALALWRKNNYAMLLTDLHMPIMDGYTLALEIRNQESDADHIPIVAYTANALKGERERCLECGMDDYLTKPITLKALNSSLATWSNSPNSKPAVRGLSEPETSTEPQAPTSPLDISILENIVGDDSKVIAKFLFDYHGAVKKASSDIGAAFQHKDWEQIKALAHTLKSLSRTMGAIALGEICAALEDAGRQRNEIAVNAAMSNFGEAMDEVDAALSMRFSQGKDGERVNQVPNPC